MKLVKKSEVHVHKNGEHCAAHEYPLGDKDINGAVIELSGRYPTTGTVCNEVCKELAYVVSGTCTYTAGGETVHLEAGDLLLIEPGERYHWEGSATLFVPCTPSWYPEQHTEYAE